MDIVINCFIYLMLLPFVLIGGFFAIAVFFIAAFLPFGVCVYVIRLISRKLK